MQLSLTSQTEPALDGRFMRLRRTQLDARSWLDYAPGFIAGHDRLFVRLVANMRWHQERRTMYQREVDVPRLNASAPADGALDPLLAEVGAALAERYLSWLARPAAVGVDVVSAQGDPPPFASVGHAYYRDGRDSVAWHRDHMPRGVETLVAILSLGAPRRVLVRPLGGGRSRTFALGEGDLFVMGGLCQTDWEHCVPKTKSAPPRMSCVFRYASP